MHICKDFGQVMSNKILQVMGKIFNQIWLGNIWNN